MDVLDKIKNRTSIDIDMFVERLSKEVSIFSMADEKKKELANEQLIYSIYDIMLIILGVTHQAKVLEELYTTWMRMTKDYWYLNKYDKKFVLETTDSNIKIKSIQVGDTTTTFADTSSQINIDGTTYNTGTIDFSEDILIEKYKKELYRHRKMRW